MMKRGTAGPLALGLNFGGRFHGRRFALAPAMGTDGPSARNRTQAGRGGQTVPSAQIQTATLNRTAAVRHHQHGRCETFSGHILTPAHAGRAAKIEGRYRLTDILPFFSPGS